MKHGIVIFLIALCSNVFAQTHDHAGHNHSQHEHDSLNAVHSHGEPSICLRENVDYIERVFSASDAFFIKDKLLPFHDTLPNILKALNQCAPTLSDSSEVFVINCFKGFILFCHKDFTLAQPVLESSLAMFQRMEAKFPHFIHRPYVERMQEALYAHVALGQVFNNIPNACNNLKALADNGNHIAQDAYNVCGCP